MALNKEIDFCAKISSEIKNTFLQIYNVLKDRETQLLRQIEVLDQHYKLNDTYDKCFNPVTVTFDNENDILKTVANFGRIDFNGLSCESDVFKIEEYQKPEIDHVLLYKYLEKSYSDHLNSSNSQAEKINLSSEEQEKENTEEDNKTEEIVKSGDSCDEVSNTILQCIEKQDPSLCLHVSNSETETEEDNLKPNLKNLTFNTVTEPPSNETATAGDNCENTHFNTHCLINSASVPNLNCKCGDNSPSVNVTKKEPAFLTDSDVKSKESVSVNKVEKLYNVSDEVKKLSMKQPVQVQQWMKQIISEPETEPGPNNVMEHSHIKVFRNESI